MSAPAQLKERKISFVIPVYNEKDTLEELYKRIEAVMQKERYHDFEVIWIDDGSTDGSWECIDKLTRKHPKHIKAIRLRRNFGKAQGLSSGFLVATGDIIFTMDADLQDDPIEISNFINKIDEGYDLVSGWKFKRLDPLSKTIPSKIFNIFAQNISGIKLHDFNCGFKAYRKEVLNAIRVYGELHRYIPILAHHQGFRIGELKVLHHPREFGKSKYGLERYVRGGLDLLTVIATTRYLQRPGHLFGGVGISLGLVGFGILAYLVAVWFSGHHIGTRPLLSFGIMMVLMGVQFISLGLIAELLVRNSSTGTATNHHILETIGISSK